MNIGRGLTKSIVYGVAGFLITSGVISTILFLVFTFGDIHPTYKWQDIRRLPPTILTPATGCGILFALAAFASFAPRHGISFGRSLVVVSSFVIVTLVVTRMWLNFELTKPTAWIHIALLIFSGGIASLVVTKIGCSRIQPKQSNSGNPTVG